MVASQWVDKRKEKKIINIDLAVIASQWLKVVVYNNWELTEIVGGEFGGVFWRRNKEETAPGGLGGGFLYSSSSRVNTLRGC